MWHAPLGVAFAWLLRAHDSPTALFEIRSLRVEFFASKTQFAESSKKLNKMSSSCESNKIKKKQIPNLFPSPPLQNIQMADSLPNFLDDCVQFSLKLHRWLEQRRIHRGVCALCPNTSRKFQFQLKFMNAKRYLLLYCDYFPVPGRPQTNYPDLGTYATLLHYRYFMTKIEYTFFFDFFGRAEQGAGEICIILSNLGVQLQAVHNPNEPLECNTSTLPPLPPTCQLTSLLNQISLRCQCCFRFVCCAVASGGWPSSRFNYIFAFKRAHTFTLSIGVGQS
jgi:hypothetical protein